MKRNIGKMFRLVPLPILFLLASMTACSAQDAGSPPQSSPSQITPSQITMGNGEFNMIKTDGLVRGAEATIFSEARTQGETVSTFRANSTALTFPEVTIKKAGWIVLHPVIDGRPNGDMVSGYTYLSPGVNKNVTLHMDHPADSGDKFLVMLHDDTNEDRVFDFVFVEDGINVEDKAVFEGNRMIAHIVSVP